MPRNSQGLYTLPGGNPVQPGTLIESDWANDTMGDIGAALTGSLPRDGSAPMTGPLTLVQGDPVNGRHAASKAYVDKFVAYSTGMPVGSVMAYASGSLPVGFLLCDGSLYQKSDYPELEALIGTTYGGTPGQTFKVPDLRDFFIRGRGPSRSIGSVQQDANKAHIHTVQDGGHSHSFTGTAGNTGAMSANASHAHAASQSPHNHTVTAMLSTEGGDGSGGPRRGYDNVLTTSTAQPGVTVNATDTNHTHAFTPAGSISKDPTGIGIGADGESEARPKNVAMDYYIKAINDSSSTIGVTSIATSDANMIAIDDTDPTIPVLDIKSNTAFGVLKLGADGKVPLGLLPAAGSDFLGYFDASSGNLPTGTPVSGAYYTISVEGTLDVYNPVTNVSSPTLVTVGTNITYLSGSLVNPDGWYYTAAATSMAAVNVSVNPAGTITSTNVQAALEELDGDITDLTAADVGALPDTTTAADIGATPRTSATGSAVVPAGTTLEQDPTPSVGYLRYNTTTGSFEGYGATGWGAIGGGGGEKVGAIYEGDATITTSYTIATGRNAMSPGPVTIDSGVTITVPAGSTWHVL